MRHSRHRPRSRRHPLLWMLGGGLAVLLLLCANLAWRALPQDTSDLPLAALRAGYDRVVPGQTETRALAALGFDAAQSGVKRLSYLALMEDFAPRDSAGFDRLDGAAQACLAAAGGCSAYVFRLARLPGSETRAAFRFVGEAQAAAADVQVVFLVHDGRVAWKAMTGV